VWKLALLNALLSNYWLISERDEDVSPVSALPLADTQYAVQHVGCDLFLYHWKFHHTTNLCIINTSAVTVTATFLKRRFSFIILKSEIILNKNKHFKTLHF